MEVKCAKLCAIGLVLDVAIKIGETMQIHGVMMVVVISDSQAAFCRAAQLEWGPVPRLVRWLYSSAWRLLSHGIAT